MFDGFADKSVQFKCEQPLSGEDVGTNEGPASGGKTGRAEQAAGNRKRKMLVRGNHNKDTLQQNRHDTIRRKKHGHERGSAADRFIPLAHRSNTAGVFIPCVRTHVHFMMPGHGICRACTHGTFIIHGKRCARSQWLETYHTDDSQQQNCRDFLPVLVYCAHGLSSMTEQEKSQC